MKRKIIMFRRILGAGFKNFFRNSWLSIAAVVVMIVALVNMLSAVVLNITTTNAVEELASNLKVSIYIADDAEEPAVYQLKETLESNEYSEEVIYVSSIEAQEKFIEAYEEDPKLLEALSLVGGETLPASIEVSVIDLSRIEEVGNIAKEDQYKAIVAEVSTGKTDNQETINKAVNVQKFITYATVSVAIIFAFVSMLIIFNTIRMAIFTRADEIRTQKLLGATPAFIRGPFLVEASLYGIVAGVISATVVVGSIYLLGDKVASTNELGLIDTYELFTKEPIVPVMMFASSVAAGVLVGITSSYLALKKHLKIKNW